MSLETKFGLTRRLVPVSSGNGRETQVFLRQPFGYSGSCPVFFPCFTYSGFNIDLDGSVLYKIDGGERFFNLSP